MHNAQRTINKCGTRFVIICAGRRFGKDILLERRVAKKVLAGGVVGFFAPTYRMMQDNYRDIKNLLAPAVTRASESDHRLELVTGGRVEMWSLDNVDAARGRKYDHAVINEAAMVRNLSDAWNMVIRPTLADRKGSADLASTPRGLNDYYRIWQQASDLKDWSRHHYRTDDNPYIAPEEIAAMRASLPARVVTQEIDAEFVEDGAYFQRIAERAIIAQPDRPDQHTGHYIVGGLDWAQSSDYTVLTLGCRDCNRVVDWDRFNKIDYSYQRLRVLEMLGRWNVAGILPETNSIGAPNIELLRDKVAIITGPDGKPGFTTTATSKPALIQSLASGLEHDGFGVPIEYADELRSYQVEYGRSGHPAFGAPDGQHDDRVISLALAWWAMTSTTNWLMS